MFDFPNSPANGQIVTNGSTSYTFDGVKWTASTSGSEAAGVSSFNTRTGVVTLSSGDVTDALTYTPYNATNPSGYQTAAQVTTALVPYAPLAAPVFTDDARAVTPTAGDNDTSIATTAFVQTAVAPAQGNVGRNTIMNGTFQVQQRGGGPWTTSGNYTADRWQVGIDGSDTASISIATLADSDRTALADDAAQYALQAVFTGSAAGASDSYWVHKIENVRRLSGKTVTLSFWARATSGTPRIGLAYVQSFGTGGSPSANVSANIAVTAALSTTWTRYSNTIALPTSVGKTFGSTFGTDTTLIELILSAAAGSPLYAVSGNLGAQSGTIQLWGIQLEIGSTATPLEKISYEDDLRHCQRFYQTGSFSYYLYGLSGWSVNVVFTPYVSFRATPTCTVNFTDTRNLSGASFGMSGDKFSLSGTPTATASVGWGGSYTASADL